MTRTLPRCAVPTCDNTSDPRFPLALNCKCRVYTCDGCPPLHSDAWEKTVEAHVCPEKAPAQPVATHRAVLMAAIDMRLPESRISAVLDALIAATRAEALEEAARISESPSGHYHIGTHARPFWDGNKIAESIRALVKP